MNKQFFLFCISAIVSTVLVAGEKKIEYVVSKYEHIYEGKHCLFYPAIKPKKMIVIFNSATPGKYSFWSWFWQDNEAWQDTAYLFLRDDLLGWYMGTGQESFVESYTKIIRKFMQQSNLNSQQVVAMGYSAGGYGALYYAVTMKLKGAVIFDPQINYASARSDGMFAVHLPGEHWQDIDKIIEKSDYVPIVSITFGSYFRDVNAAHALIAVLKKKKASLIVHNTKLPTHTGVINNLSKSFIERELLYIDRYVGFNNKNISIHLKDHTDR